MLGLGHRNIALVGLRDGTHEREETPWHGHNDCGQEQMQQILGYSTGQRA